MTAAYDYIGRRHAQAHAEGIELDRVRTDIAEMKVQLEKLTSNLDAAEQYAGVLTTSILMAQQLVEDECKKYEWPIPEPVEPEPAPSPIEQLARSSVDTGPARTVAFPAIRAALPVSGDNGAVVCGQPECGEELVQRDGVWVHTSTGAHNCNSEVGSETRADDPLRLQQLDQGEVREAVNGGE